MGKSHALINRVAGPFMSSASSSRSSNSSSSSSNSSSSSGMVDVAVRSCVRARKLFFSVYFTGGQGYSGGKRNAVRGEGGAGDGARILRSTITTREFVLFLSLYLFTYLSIYSFLYNIDTSDPK